MSGPTTARGLYVRSIHTLLCLASATALLIKHKELGQRMAENVTVTWSHAFIALTFTALLMYFITCLVGPGYVATEPKGLGEEEEVMGVDGRPLLRHCGFCGITQPLRARHCEECARCVRKFDHHCPWLDVCIGEKNHRFFLLFLVLQTAVTWWAALLTWRSLVRDMSREWLVVHVVLVLVLGPGLLAASSLCVVHSYLAATNQTSWEFISWTKITYLHKLDFDQNPFDRGLCCNVAHFLCNFRPQRWDNLYRKSTLTSKLVS